MTDEKEKYIYDDIKELKKDVKLIIREVENIKARILFFTSIFSIVGAGIFQLILTFIKR